MVPKIKSEELEIYCNNFFKKWNEDFGANKYELCKQQSSIFIDDLKQIYNARLYGEGDKIGDLYTYIYLFLMLAKGLEDVINLVRLTKDKKWPQDNKKVELIWQVLWDAKERLGTFSSHCLDDVLTDLDRKLDELEYCFYDIFGKGLYMSTVIIIKKSNCSICNQNIKACIHLPGNIYNGFLCHEKPIDFTISGADIVQSPQDMRCRIWPWNFTDDMTFTARLLNLNRLDDFIKAENNNVD